MNGEKESKVEKITSEELFKDAEFLYQEAIEELDRGKVRNAAEKAWGATLRAANGLILARMSVLPQYPSGESGTAKMLAEISYKDSRIEEKRIEARYYTNQGSLHGECFYRGVIDDKYKKRIIQTIDFIKDVRELSNTGKHLT